MQFIKIILTSIGSIIAMFISTKIIGNKQMSELNMFDYINGITIGSIGAEMATSLDGDFYYPLISIAIYTAVIWIISYVSGKSLAARRILNGKSIVLMEKGKLYRHNFNTAKIDLNEFLTQCRISGYFSLDDIDTAILEQNGKVSFLPKVSARTVNTQDLNLSPEQEKINVSVILDGKIIEQNLQSTGHDIIWLEKELRRQKIKSTSDVFLASCDGEKLSVYIKVNSGPSKDFFQ